MKKNYKKIIASAIILLGILGGVNYAHANPSGFGATQQTSSATTSPVYLTPGTGTSTLTFDSYGGSSSPALALKNNDAFALLRFAGSSTASVLGINAEYSQDCIDWYSDSLVTAPTTTAVNSLNVNNSMSWTFASSTVGGKGLNATTGATSTKAIRLQTPTRCMRLVFSITGGNGALWGQIVPVREVRQ